jgi:hypothetical protein
MVRTDDKEHHNEIDVRHSFAELINNFDLVSGWGQVGTGHCNRGDQTGQIFACWAICFFGGSFMKI